VKHDVGGWASLQVGYYYVVEPSPNKHHTLPGLELHGLHFSEPVRIGCLPYLDGSSESDFFGVCPDNVMVCPDTRGSKLRNPRGVLTQPHENFGFLFKDLL
jgi:hypothetical protein